MSICSRLSAVMDPCRCVLAQSSLRMSAQISCTMRSECDACDLISLSFWNKSWIEACADAMSYAA